MVHTQHTFAKCVLHFSPFRREDSRCIADGGFRECLHMYKGLPNSTAPSVLGEYTLVHMSPMNPIR